MHQVSPIIRNRIQCARAALENAVRDAVAQGGPVSFECSYADGLWFVEVSRDGATRYEGYAATTRGSAGSLDDLQLWELARLAESLLLR